MFASAEVALETAAASLASWGSSAGSVALSAARVALAALSAAVESAMFCLFWALVSDSEVLAVDSWSVAWSTESFAAATVSAVGAATSSSRRACAASTFAWAVWSWTWSDESSMVARTWPSVTVSPTAALTAVTVPALSKLSSLIEDEAIEPEMLTLLTIVPVVAVPVTSVAASVPNGLAIQNAAAATSTAIRGTMSHRQRRRRPGGSPRSESLNWNSSAQAEPGSVVSTALVICPSRSCPSATQ